MNCTLYLPAPVIASHSIVNDPEVSNAIDVMFGVVVMGVKGVDKGPVAAEPMARI
jgi:hypothetical protein